MSNFTPSLPYTVPIFILAPTTKIVKGVPVKSYPEPSEDNLAFCSFKTYGGTETESNGVITVVDTANVETFYNPEIKADCRIMLAETSELYEVMGKPEDIDQRHQFVKFKVRGVAGGA